MSKHMVPSLHAAACPEDFRGAACPESTTPLRKGGCCSGWNFLVSRGSHVHLSPRDSEGKPGRGREGLWSLGRRRMSVAGGRVVV